MIIFMMITSLIPVFAESCDCVIFRFVDVQDFYLNNPRIDVMDTFINQNEKVSLSIILNSIENDTSIINKVAQGQQSDHFELTLHGFNHENFATFNFTEQKNLMELSQAKMQSLWGVNSTSFVPPMHQWNNNTLQVMKDLNISIISAGPQGIDPPENIKFIANPPSNITDGFGLYHLPQTSEFYDHGVFPHAKIPHDDIMAAVDAAILQYGYSVLNLYGTDFAQKDISGNALNITNSTEINDLLSIINAIRTKGYTITTFEEITKTASSSLWQSFPLMPLSRSDYTGNAVENKVYLMQGIDAEMNFTMYDTVTGNYTELSTAPYAAHHSASAVHNGKIYVAGGCDFGNSCASAAVYDIVSNTWSNLPNMPLPNWAPTAKIVGNEFFVIGGSPNLKACQKYNIPGNSWSSCTEMPTGREHLSSAVFNNKIYVINGRGGEPGDPTANEVYDPATNSWEILADKPTGMSGGWGGTFNNKIFVVGGESSLTGANEWYDPVTNTWVIGPDMPTPRHGLVCESVDSKIYCFGGGTIEGGGISSIVEVFDADSFLQNNFEICQPPSVGDWIITQDCTLTINSTVPADVFVQNNSILTVPSGMSLDIDFSQFNLTIEFGSGVLIKLGGTVT